MFDSAADAFEVSELPFDCAAVYSGALFAPLLLSPLLDLHQGGDIQRWLAAGVDQPA